MEVSINSKGLEFGDTFREYVERKVSKLDRFLSDIDQAQVDLVVQNTRSAEDRQVAQITLWGSHGIVLRTEERSADMYSSIDTALDKMERQIKRYKGKHWRSRARHKAERREAFAPEEIEEEPANVVRVKEFLTRPMDVDEAIEQMELLGHDFFVFYNVGTNNYSVVYRRSGEGYGLLLPELA